jgi:hypothetical protein
MKNLHLLKTNKPSRLYLYKSNGCLFLTPNYMDYKGDTAPNQNIYITSDKTIKQGDWYLEPDVDIKPTWCKDISELTSADRKIILTTDKDLIDKYGVAPIGDKFLEWFIKNPTCEKVKVKTAKLKIPDRYGNDYRIIQYLKVVIPKVNKKLYSNIENLIIEWNIDGTKTAGELTRDIMKLI